MAAATAAVCGARIGEDRPIRISGLFAALCAASLVLLAATQGARAQDERLQHVLGMITDTAQKICQSVPPDASNSGYTLSTDAKASLNGIVRNLADLGIGGAAQYQSQSSMGVLQQQLADAIKNGNDCRRDVFNTLERDLIRGQFGAAPPAAPPPQSYATAPPRPAPYVPPAPPPAPQPVPYAAPAPAAARPGVGDLNIAQHLAGQSWEFPVDGAPLVIRFLPDNRAELSDSRFGRSGTWRPLSSFSFNVDTDAGASFSGWFNLNGNGAVTGCEMVLRTPSRAPMADSNQPMHVVGCRRVG